jgi:uncharacterized protein (DUF2147 family)
MSRSPLVGLLVLLATSSTAAAEDVTGEWAREDGKTKVRISSCSGETVCGEVSWIQDPGGPHQLRQQVFFDMKPNGDNTWSGTAFDPEDGQRYSGKMTLSGDHLVTAGCVAGGLICKSFSWTRAR